MKRAQRLLVALLLLSAPIAFAQDWPARPVRLIVPFPAGGSTDVAARTLAERLSRSLGAPFVVENRAGGGGVVGISEVARAASDGYTVVVAPDAITTLPVVVKETLPGLAFAYSGAGSGQHMSGELLKKMAGIDIVHVPYKGGGPAVQDLVGGHVPMGVLGSTPLIPHHKAGKIRILAFTSKDRFAPMPEIPTLHESGFPGFDTGQWLGLLVPRGTPNEIVQKLYKASAEALAAPEVRERLAQSALVPVGSSPKEFEALIRADLERWSKLGGELGIKPQ